MLVILFTVMTTVIVLGLGMAVLFDIFEVEGLRNWCFMVALCSMVILVTGAIIVALWEVLVFT